MKKNLDLSKYEIESEGILKNRFLLKLWFAVAMLVCMALLSSCTTTHRNCMGLDYFGSPKHKFHVGVTG